MEEKNKKEDKRPTVIRVNNLVKEFDGRRVIDNLNFEVKKGEILVLMGGSGCGKSTLLRHLIGAMKPTSGSIEIFNQDITKLHEEELNKVRLKFGILFQSGALYNSMTLGENVALPLREHTDLPEETIQIMVKMKLEMVGLRDFEHLLPSQISGGMKKRIGLARAIALDPELMYYDEPSAGLDPIVSGVIDELMIDLNKKMGITSVVVTHEMDSAFRIATRMILLYKGAVVADGTPQEIKNSKEPLVQQFINGSPDGPIPLRISKKDYLEDLFDLSS